MTKLNEAMQEIADLNDKGGKGTVNLKGKTYTSVATRVQVFRKHFGTSVGIQTKPHYPAAGGVMMLTEIVEKETGFVLATGEAYTHTVSKEKGIEKLASVAVGRALACLGLSGGEYASDNEIESWPERYDHGIHPSPSEVTAKDLGKTPREWLEERLKNLEQFANTCPLNKGTMELFDKRCKKIGTDSIYGELTQEDVDFGETVMIKLGNFLKERLEKKNDS